MKLSTFLILACGAAIAISVLDEENTKNNKKGDLKTITKDLATRADELINETKGMSSDEMRINLESQIAKLKVALRTFDYKEVSDAGKSFLQKVATELRKISVEIRTEQKQSSKSKATKTAKTVEKAVKKTEPEKKEAKAKPKKTRKKVSKAKK